MGEMNTTKSKKSEPKPERELHNRELTERELIEALGSGADPWDPASGQHNEHQLKWRRDGCPPGKRERNMADSKKREPVASGGQTFPLSIAVSPWAIAWRTFTNPGTRQ